MPDVKRTIFSGMQILSDRQWLKNYAIVVEDNIIKGMITVDKIKHHLPAERYEFPHDHYLSPPLGLLICIYTEPQALM